MPFVFNPITGNLDKISTVGNATGENQFDGSQDSWLLTFLRSGVTGTIEWNGTDSYFKFNNPNTDAVTMVAGNPSTELLAILSIFNFIDVTSAGYSSDETCVLFAESKGNILGGPLIGGIYNPGTHPVTGDVLASFLGAGYSSVAGLPTAGSVDVRAAANWSTTSTPSEVAIKVMSVGEIDPDVPHDTVIFRSDNTIDFVGTDSTNPQGKLTYDNVDSSFGDPRNTFIFTGTTGGVGLVAGQPTTSLQGFLDIIGSLSSSVSSQGVSGSQGTLICETTDISANLGALTLYGTSTGTAPVDGEPITTNITFASDGAGGVFTHGNDVVLARENWATGGNGFARLFLVCVVGETDDSEFLILDGGTGVIINNSNHAAIDFIVKSAGGKAFEVDSSANAIGYFGVTPVVRQTGGAATAGATYTATEQTMLNAVYGAMRNYGLLT